MPKDIFYLLKGDYIFGVHSDVRYLSYGCVPDRPKAKSSPSTYLQPSESHTTCCDVQCPHHNLS